MLVNAQAPRHFEAQAAHLIHVARRHRSDCALVVLDVDGMPPLRDVEGVLVRSVRCGDAAGRIEASTFAVCLAQANYRSALCVAARLRRVFEDGQVSASDGVPCRPVLGAAVVQLMPGESFDDMKARAFGALRGARPVSRGNAASAL